MGNVKQIFILLLLFTATLLIGCAKDEEECPDDNLPYLRLNAEKTSNLAIDSVLIYNDKIAEYLDHGVQFADCVLIPLDLNSNLTLLKFKFTLIADSAERATDPLLAAFSQYFIDSVAEITDNVSFSHSKTVKLNDLECGFITEFNLQQISFTNQIIDSIYIFDTIINSVEKNHVTIFY